ncbi:StAR-related lipid transfer protein 5 [Mizuhopecten yessoensis]|uniref:StAR-related lipid transfer protein 5 n=1 Tax=Mizuhopecten yessoensis TaxID=6573 RepID=A0A210QLJ9_MIZYE|nr:StAR-related lipid transfer protein 5 [Mizuhopecten yessoensis]
MEKYVYHLILTMIVLLTALCDIDAHESDHPHTHPHETQIKTSGGGSFIGFGDLLPPTCRELMETLKINMSRLQNKPLHVKDEFSSLAVYCPFSTLLLTCLMQNIYEIRQTQNALIWSSGYLLNFRLALDISQKLCLWHQYPGKGTKQCLAKTERARELCRERVVKNLQYVRTTMYPEIKTYEQFNMICSVQRELPECVATELTGQCDNETVSHMKMFYEMLGRQNCSVMDPSSSESKSAAQANLKEVLVRKALSGCGFEESLYGLPAQKFSFERYVTSLTKICGKLDSIISCLREQIGDPKTSIQRYLKESIDLKAMTSYTHTLCSAEWVFRKEVKCLKGLDTNVEYCINAVKSNNMIDRYYDTHKRKEPMICSVLEDFSNCFTIQTSRCNSKLSDILKKSHTDGMHGMCKLGKHTPSHIGGSVLLHCGVTMAIEVQGQIATVKNNGSTMLTIIDRLIDYGCSELDRYMNCLDRYFDQSKSLLDGFMRTILNFSNKEKMGAVLKETCHHASHIKRNMPCLLQHEREFQTCASISLPMVKNNLMTLQNTNGKQLRAKFCSDLASLMTCSINVLGHCDKSLATLANDTVIQILNQEHCGEINMGLQGRQPNNASIPRMFDALLHCLLAFFIYLLL